MTQRDIRSQSTPVKTIKRGSRDIPASFSLSFSLAIFRPYVNDLQKRLLEATGTSIVPLSTKQKRLRTNTLNLFWTLSHFLQGIDRLVDQPLRHHQRQL